MDKNTLSEPNFKLEDIYKKHYLNVVPESAQNPNKPLISESFEDSTEDDKTEDRFDELFESILKDSDLYSEADDVDQFAQTEGNPQDVNQTSPQDELSQYDDPSQDEEDVEGTDTVEVSVELLRPLYDFLKAQFEGGEEDSLDGSEEDVIPMDDDTDLNPDELPTEAVKNPHFPAPKRPPFKSRTKVKKACVKNYPNERYPKKASKSRYVKSSENWV